MARPRSASKANNQNQRHDHEQGADDNSSAHFAGNIKASIMAELAKLAGGAFSVAVGLRDEFRERGQAHAANVAQDLDLVSRDEFEVLKQMLVKARLVQDELLQRVKALEQGQHADSASKAAAKKPAKKLAIKPAQKTRKKAK